VKGLIGGASVATGGKATWLSRSFLSAAILPALRERSRLAEPSALV